MEHLGGHRRHCQWCAGRKYRAGGLRHRFRDRKRLRRHTPERSVVGILLSVLSLVVMPLLARAKRRMAAQLNSRALHADSRQTSICAYLSAILLGGLLLNALLGWWWADPIAALVMVPIILK